MLGQHPFLEANWFLKSNLLNKSRTKLGFDVKVAATISQPRRNVSKCGFINSEFKGM